MVSNKFKVSIIVAIYKSEKFLRKLLDSIMEQTYDNLEVILVDDGSPDLSGQICDEYVARDSRFNVIHQDNAGTCSARNAGIEKVTGEYLLIIDGDDWLEKDYVEYLLNLAVTTNSDMAMTDKVFTTLDRIQVEKDSIEVWSSEKASASIIYPIIPIGPWNKIYRTKMINDNNLRFSVKWSGEGLYFSCMAAQFSNQVCVGSRKIYNYRLNNPNSGLTKYNLEIATNALENIYYIRDVSTIRTSYMMNAFNWHIWKNNYYVMYLIIATDSLRENRKLYDECKQYLKENFWSTVHRSSVSIKEKVIMVAKRYFPILYAKRKLFKKQKKFKKDSME
ncbi:MAG: glycosyltransferase [Lachnospiraceae bacterium]|nr:glycosyltransferase [Lachnospiraceae bacterium]